MNQQESPLRIARRAKSLTITDLANRIGFDASYLSLVENGKKKPSERFLVAYARALDLPEEEFFSEFETGLLKPSFARPILKIFKEFSLANPERASEECAKVQRRLERTSARTLCDRVSRLFLEAVTKRTARHLISIRYSRGHYEALDEDIFRCYAPLCSHQQIPIWVLFRPHTDGNYPDEYFADIGYLICNQLPFLDVPTDIVAVDSIPLLQTGFSPLDLHLALPAKGVLCFGSQPFAVEAAADITIPRSEAAKLHEHGESLRAYRDRKVLLFKHSDFMRFVEEQVNLITQRERSYIAQRFLGGCSRPPSDFREGTSWYAHYSALKDRGPIDMRRLIDLRLEISRQGRLKNVTTGMRQICSRSAVEQWARQGQAVDKPKHSRSVDTKPDRLARIDYLRFLVESSNQFEIAAINDEDGQELGWGVSDTERDLSWSVEGSSGVILETTYGNRSDARWREAQCIIQSDLAANAFATHFERTWDRISPKLKDRASTLAWISHLRRLAETADS